MVRRFVLIGAVALLAVAAVACGSDGDDEEEGTPTRPPATEQPTQVPDETSEPEPQPTPGVTEPMNEIANLTRVILQTARDNRLDLLEELGKFSPVPCTDIVQGIGGPPECRDGEADGTPVNVMLAASCEGYYVRENELAWENLKLAVDDASPVYGVYRVTTSNILQGWPAAEYAFVLKEATPDGRVQALALYTDTEGIVGFVQACGDTPEQFVERQALTDVVIEPGTAN